MHLGTQRREFGLHQNWNWYYLASAHLTMRSRLIQHLSWSSLKGALEVVVSKVRDSGTSCAWKKSCECILLESSVSLGILWLTLVQLWPRTGRVLLLQCKDKKIFGHTLTVCISAAIFRPKTMCVNRFTLKVRRGSFAKINSGFQSLPGSLEHKGWLRALTHHQEAGGGGESPYLLSYLGCGNQWRGGVGRGSCWWENRGKVKHYDSFHFFGKQFGNSHPFLCPSWQLELF